MVRKVWSLFLAYVLLGMWAGNLLAGDTPDLTTLSLEELIDIEVVSLSKRAQKLSDTAAPVFVIGQEDIRRSGASTIPDLLRMVPGLDVARIDASKWAVSARGFNGRFANKLLVLIDGRSVYNPLYSGVLWEMQDTLLEDIDRIEVVRGPGGTIWGANAVNGVINIITKPAKDTIGTLVTAGTGTEEQGFGSVRFGGQTPGGGAYRLYGKYRNVDDGESVLGEDGKDGWDGYLAGFRSDWNDKLMFQGEIFSSDTGNIAYGLTLMPPYVAVSEDHLDSFAGHGLARWEDEISESSRYFIQLYYDRSEYNVALLDTTVDTIDIDTQLQFALGKHQITWGLGYRFIQDDLVEKTIELKVKDDSCQYDLWSGFIQDELSWLDDRLRLTIGSKFEHNDFSGFEVQPSIRGIYSPGRSYSLWASVSRAVRTPGRLEVDVEKDLAVYPPDGVSPLTTVIRAYGDENFDSERLTAYELGLRLWPAERVSLDITPFYNVYDNFRSNSMSLRDAFMEPTPFPPHLVIPGRLANNMEAETYGVEVAADWLITDKWKLKGAYSFLKVHMDSSDPGTTAEEKGLIEGNSPQNQLSLRSSMNLLPNVDLDVWGRYVDSLRYLDIDSYFEADVILSWRATKNVTVSLFGRNLLDRAHLEQFSEFVETTETEAARSVHARLMWAF